MAADVCLLLLIALVKLAKENEVAGLHRLETGGAYDKIPADRSFH
jgi:hypothetical protein